MPAGGSCTFSQVDDYEAGLQQVFDIVVARPCQFQARLTWAVLPTLRLFRAHEASPRLARISLPRAWVIVSFPIRRGSQLVSDGQALQFGDIMVHSLGERLHQRIGQDAHWGAVYLTPQSMMDIGRTIAGQDLAPPSRGTLLRPPPADWRLLLRQHTAACRIAETNLHRIGHSEVARSLEQEVTWALVSCLTNADPVDDAGPARQQADVIARFEAVLTETAEQLVDAAEIAAVIGVSEHSLRSSCSNVLGMSPSHYQRLRHLKRARAELLAADDARSGLVEIARRHGFKNIHRFVAAYRQVYGDAPFLQP